ncbi:hypothetical protein GGR57DRAFT_519358 [Xylariaceae sp. FL1272]|nr:hypothetical protein GGR57DRAFT_519358 [Xylariaceae sp. FL1272]
MLRRRTTRMSPRRNAGRTPRSGSESTRSDALIEGTTQPGKKPLSGRKTQRTKSRNFSADGSTTAQADYVTGVLAALRATRRMTKFMVRAKRVRQSTSTEGEAQSATMEDQKPLRDPMHQDDVRNASVNTQAVTSPTIKEESDDEADTKVLENLSFISQLDTTRDLSLKWGAGDSPFIKQEPATTPYHDIVIKAEPTTAPTAHQDPANRSSERYQLRPMPAQTSPFPGFEPVNVNRDFEDMVTMSLVEDAIEHLSIGNQRTRARLS